MNNKADFAEIESYLQKRGIIFPSNVLIVLIYIKKNQLGFNGHATTYWRSGGFTSHRVIQLLSKLPQNFPHM